GRGSEAPFAIGLHVAKSAGAVDERSSAQVSRSSPPGPVPPKIIHRCPIGSRTAVPADCCSRAGGASPVAGRSPHDIVSPNESDHVSSKKEGSDERPPWTIIRSRHGS